MRRNDLIIATTLINDVLSFDNMVLLATDSGTYFSSDYGENFDYSHSAISATKIYKFARYKGRIFAGTDNGVFVLQGNDWKQFALEGEDIYSLMISGEKFFFGGENSLFVFQGNVLLKRFGEIGRVQSFEKFSGKFLTGTSKGLFDLSEDYPRKIFDKPVLALSGGSNLFIGLHSGIAYSSDLEKFEEIPLKEEIIRAVLSVNRKNKEYVFAGSDSGLWVSLDSGKSFPVKKLKNVHIFSLSPSVRNEEIFVGSWGRGLIKYSLDNI